MRPAKFLMGRGGGIRKLDTRGDMQQLTNFLRCITSCCYYIKNVGGVKSCLSTNYERTTHNKAYIMRIKTGLTEAKMAAKPKLNQ